MRYQLGDIITAAGGTFTSKLRPIVIFQNPEVGTGDSVIVMPLTSYSNKENELRIPVEPNDTNGLDRHCWLEVDKLSAIRVNWLGAKVGRLDEPILDDARTMILKLLSA